MVHIQSVTTKHFWRSMRMESVSKGECIPCNTSWCLSCKQITATTTCESTQTKEKFSVHHKISSKRKYVIYLLGCLTCKIHYVGKADTPFPIRLNNHSKNIKSPNTVKACKHFHNWTHVFHKHGKFLLL